MLLKYKINDGWGIISEVKNIHYSIIDYKKEDISRFTVNLVKEDYEGKALNVFSTLSDISAPMFSILTKNEVYLLNEEGKTIERLQ